MHRNHVVMLQSKLLIEIVSQAKCDTDKVRSQPRTQTTDLRMHNPFRANETSRG
jgi:hypothetical protein